MLELRGVSYRYAGYAKPVLHDIDLSLRDGEIVGLVGPVILGSIAEVEERTMALEARGFTRPGRRTLLWMPPDSRKQAIARWALLAGLVLAIAARFAGFLG